MEAVDLPLLMEQEHHEEAHREAHRQTNEVDDRRGAVAPKGTPRDFEVVEEHNR
jgi:hypothetical protein